MTVTTLPIRPPLRRLTHPRKPGIRPGLTRRRVRSHADNAPTLTLTFELTFSGDASYNDAVELLETLREINRRLHTARMRHTITPYRGGPTNSVHDGPSVSAVTAALQPPLNPSTPMDDDATIRIQPDTRSIGTRRVDRLTRVEFDLLLFLALHSRRVFTRAQLLQSVWGYAHTSDRRSTSTSDGCEPGSATMWSPRCEASAIDSPTMRLSGWSDCPDRTHWCAGPVPE